MKNLPLLAALAGLASAQPKLSDLVVMTFADVTPSMAAEFEARGATIREAYQRSGAPFRLGYTPLFGSTFTHLSITPVTEITNWDHGPDLRNKMGEAAYQKWLPDYRKTITGTQRKMARLIPDLTIQDAPMASQPILVMQVTRVEFSRRAEFEARIRNATIPALKRAGVKRYVVRRTVFGGPSNESSWRASTATWPPPKRPTRQSRVFRCRRVSCCRMIVLCFASIRRPALPRAWRSVDHELQLRARSGARKKASREERRCLHADYKTRIEGRMQLQHLY